MPAQTRALARVANQLSDESQKEMALSVMQQDSKPSNFNSSRKASTGTAKKSLLLDITTEAAQKGSVWQLPGFLFHDGPNCAFLAVHFLSTEFTDPAVLKSSMSDEEKLSISANNILSVLFKALIFHQEHYRTRKHDLIAFLQRTILNNGTRGAPTRPRDIEHDCIDAYVLARRAFLTRRDPSIPGVRTVLTGLVDKWISFSSTSHLRAAPLNAEFVERKLEWLKFSKNGALMNAGQVVEDNSAHSDVSSSEGLDGESSDESDSEGSDSDKSGDSDNPASLHPEATPQSRRIKSEPSDDEETNTLDNPASSSSRNVSAIDNAPHHHKRKAEGNLAQAAIKRRALFYASAVDFDTSDEDFESDPEVDVKGALTELRELAERRHTRQLAKLRKMKTRYSNQKKQVANLQEQMAEITNAQSTQVSLSTTVKGNAKSLKGLTKDLEQQRKTVKKVEARVKELKPRKAGEPDATTQNIMDKIQARVKSEVKTTWTGAAMELSNTKRDFFKTMNDQGRRISGQKERLDSLESRVTEQTSITDRHEKLILDQENISAQQANRVTKVESSVTSRLDQQEDRLTSVEMRLVGQRHHYARPPTPTTPRLWLSEHSPVHEASELRGIIASQGEALRIQGKQLREMSKETSSLRELCKNLAEEMKQVCGKPDIPGLDKITKEVGRLKEIRQLLSTMSGGQSSGEELDAPSGAVSPLKDLKPTTPTLEDVSEEITNLRHMRTALSRVLNRQSLEEALENC